LKSFDLIAALALATALGLSGCEKAAETTDNSTAIEEATASPTVLEKADFPSFTLPDVDGVEHTLADWDGRPRLVNFWATWCAPCRREIPLLKSVQDQQGEDGVQIIGIAVDFPEEVAAYAENVQFNYPILVGQEDAMAFAETSGVDFFGLPFTMIISADGELLTSHIGEIHAEDLNNIVEVLNQLTRGDIDKAAARDALNSI
jgi:thiol-disulfide isomerase/thioredoxin